MVSEAGGAGAVVVFVLVGFVGDFAVFFEGWERVVADAAGPVFGVVGHGFLWVAGFLRVVLVFGWWRRPGLESFVVAAD